MYRGKCAAGEENKGEGDEVETSILFMARIDAWIMMVMKRFRLEERQCGNRRRDYVQTVKGFFQFEMKEIICAIFELANASEPNEIEISTDLSNII